MTTHVALLRGINVGGHKPVAMADLRDLLTQLGFVEPRTLLQSGNVVFGSNARTAAQLERVLDAEAAKRLGLQTAWFVRTAEEWKAISLIEKMLGTRGTGRNWNTALKLAALTEA